MSAAMDDLEAAAFDTSLKAIDALHRIRHVLLYTPDPEATHHELTAAALFRRLPISVGVLNAAMEASGSAYDCVRRIARTHRRRPRAAA